MTLDPVRFRHPGVNAPPASGQDDAEDGVAVSSAESGHPTDGVGLAADPALAGPSLAERELAALPQRQQ